MRLTAIGILSASLIAVASVSVATDYPVDRWKTWLCRSTDRYPQQTWLRYATPEEAGWSSAKLARAKAQFDSIDSAAVLVVHDGAVVIAWGDVDRRFMCHSIRKSLLSALYGIHVARGTIDCDKTLAELAIDDDPPLSDAEKQARVIDLLRSRSGVFHSAAYESAQMKVGRPPRGSHAPGEIFWYNNWDFNVLGTIFEQQTGTKIFEEFKRQFAIPLGMEDYRATDGYYHLEREHSIHPAYPFRMTARDMARLGLLYLREGQWEDRQILPRQWVRDTITSHFTEADTTRNPEYTYGYLWWRIAGGPLGELGMFSARGHGGHSIDVLPAAGVVFVHRVNTYGDTPLPLEMDEVEDPDRFKLLDLVLQARLSPPKPEPKLVPLPARPNRPDVVQLDPKVLARCVGEYEFKGFTLSVKETGKHLSVHCPEIGHFRLEPLSKTRFLIEDIELVVEFEQDDDGEVARMIGHFVPGRPSVGKRIH